MLTRPFASLALVLLVVGCGRRPELPSIQPTARYATAAAIMDGTVYVLGGVERGAAGDTVVAAVEAYDPDSRQWTRRAPMSSARAFAAAAEFDGRIYVFGGLDDSGEVLGSVEIYDPEEDTWRAGAPMDAARSRHAAANHMGIGILVAGGVDGSEATSSRAWIYLPRENSWREWVPLPTPRHGFALVDVDDGTERAFAVGGYDDRAPLSRTDGFGVALVRARGPDDRPRRPGATSADGPTGKTAPLDQDHRGYDWRPAPSLAQARGFLGAALIGNRIYAVGGRCPAIPATEVLDVLSVEAGWTPAAPLPKDLCRFSVVAWNGRLLVFGGETEYGDSVNTDVLEYDPARDTWSVRPRAP